jgi:hypothetical protein
MRGLIRELAQLPDIYTDVFEKLVIHGAQIRHCFLFQATGPAGPQFGSNPDGKSLQTRRVCTATRERTICMSVHGLLSCIVLRLLSGRLELNAGRD